MSETSNTPNNGIFQNFGDTMKFYYKLVTELEDYSGAIAFTRWYA